MMILENLSNPTCLRFYDSGHEHASRILVHIPALLGKIFTLSNFSRKTSHAPQAKQSSSTSQTPSSGLQPLPCCFSYFQAQR